jgi:thiamine-monophosphate kinase
MSTAPLAGEDALIAALAGCLPPARHTRLAIGDDAAAIALPGDELLLVTTDLLMEDVHFRLRWGDLPALGWKALAQNFSDIAAMGGAPTHAVVALALPPAFTPAQAMALYDGLGALAREAGVDVVGGDTVRSAGPLTISLTVLGRVAEAELLTRAGACPGDALYVTGALGLAAAGLQVLETGVAYPDALRPCVDAQLRPRARLAAGRALAAAGPVTAMMDLSDGVATDLHRLCHMSGVGARLDRDALPIAPAVMEACDWLAARAVVCDPLDLALRGGEDFELLLTAPAAAETVLRAAMAPLPLTRIGTMTAAPELLLVAGGGAEPLPWGFTHF